MARGVFFYLIIWLLVTAAFNAYSRLRRSTRMTLLRCFLYGLGTATVALGLVLLVVYLF